MPYDAQGRWIEENEWERMMRERAAQRVQAFSRYNAAPPSLYPNQAAPYGSFPYADPTPAIWDSSPERLRQDVPADPKYQGWDFNQEPIADTSAISNVPQMAFGAFGAQHVPALPVTPPGTMNFQDFLDKVGPVQSGTRDAYYMPDGTVRNAAGDLVSTDTTFDPTGGLAATDPNLQGVTPTSTVSTGLYSEAGVPMSNENLSWFGAAPVPTSPSMNVDYGPALQTIDVGIPPADLGVTTQPTTPSYPSGITPTDSIIPVADLGGNDSIAVQTQVDDFSDMPSWDTSAVSTAPQMADTSSPIGRVMQDYLSRIGITDSPYQDAIDATGDPVMQDLLSHFDLSNIPGGRTINAVREVFEDKDESLADYIRDVQIDQFKQDNPNATIDDVVAVITSGNKNKTFLMESDTDFAEKISKAKKSDEIMIAKARQQKAAAQAQRDAARAEQQAAAAAARASKQMANRKAAQRKAMLARKAKAKSKLAAQKAAAAQARAQAAAARQAQAAAQAQAQSEANAAIERVAQARSLMGSRAYQESGMGGLSAAERDIVAAAQVDTFAGIGGMGMGFMGSNVGQEDGGGYTGGDFSSGAGWE